MLSYISKVANLGVLRNASWMFTNIFFEFIKIFLMDKNCKLVPQILSHLDYLCVCQVIKDLCYKDLLKACFIISKQLPAGFFAV